MEYSTISISLDDTLLEQAKKLFEELGLDIETAVNVFLKQCVREQRIPFRIGEVFNVEKFED